MNLGEDLIRKLSKLFAPSSTVQFRYRGKDVSVQTDEEGHAIKMFIGKLKDDGMVSGDRYARVLVRDRNGAFIKDHWDRKGRAT
ncbi:MAG: hypothetical protein ACJ75B_14465 [Flavisolibacter sp.]